MKRFSLLFFLFLISTFHAFAQAHFITAGQTQGMIYTDYVPDYRVPQTVVINSGTYGGVSLNLNYDNFPDFSINFNSTYHNASSTAMCELSPYYPFDFIRCKYDTTHEYGTTNLNHTPQLVSKKYFANDTLNDLNDTLWQNASILIQRSATNGGHSSVLTDYIEPIDSPYYYFIKVIMANDTLLGYIHFSTTNRLLDYAIEGPTSSYIISSVNSLSPYYISISPNPFTNQISISTEKPFQYTITDYSGRLLLSGTSDKTIATETIPAGSYLLTIKNEKVFSVKKMVKVD